MTKEELRAAYHAYIACLNERDWSRLGQFVDADVVHNSRPLGLAGYRALLEGNCRQIPDLRFEIERLIADPPYVASRLRFDVTPTADFLGLPVNGRRVIFCENVFYEFQNGRVRQVWSVIDKAALEAQL